MNFTPQTYEIRLFNPDTEDMRMEARQGVVAEGVGLAYCQDELDQAYTVTHLASGYALPYYPLSEEHTRKWIEAIAALFDWHMPAKEIYSLLDQAPTERIKLRQALMLITEDFISARELMSKKHHKFLHEKARELAQNL